MSRTMAGESMIKALDTRLKRVRSTSAELDRVGAFYSRIIELCVSNPPKDNRHLRALEEQVCTRINTQRRRPNLPCYGSDPLRRLGSETCFTFSGRKHGRIPRRHNVVG